MPVDRFPESLSGPLLAWYDSNARTLPWRRPPGSAGRPDPYPVWLSEIMAQQTRVDVAARYWRRFLRRWPTVDALAAADETEVLREWAGLGYYARARNLMATARLVAARGAFPTSAERLRELPGIGRYTAAAIAAIAFGEAVVAVDANVARVAARLFAIDAAPAALPDRARPMLAPFVPPARPGDFTEALMDLGAGICTPHGPDCPACPLQHRCAARLAGTVGQYPARAPAKPRPRRRGLAWWIEHEGALALVRRPRRGLLGGMAGLPGTPWSEHEADRFPFDSAWDMQPFAIRHVFSHFELHLKVAKTVLGEPLSYLGEQPLLWVPVDKLADAGLPSLYRHLYRRVVEHALQQKPLPHAGTSHV